MTNSQWFKERDFTLVLSSGFFGFFSHCGFVQALFEKGIQPSKYIGCSAGALVGASLASGNSVLEIKERLFSLRKNDFWDPSIGFGLLQGKKFDAILGEFLKREIQDCETPFESVVLDIFKWRILNLKQGQMSTAVRASCAVPGLFQPVKHDGRWLWDGGVYDKVGLMRASEEPRIFSHYLHSPKERPLDLKKGVWPKELNLLINGQSTDWRGLIIEDVVRVTPDSLENGPLAYQYVYQKTSDWLDEEFQKPVDVISS